MKYYIFGLQRSGTNVIDTFLKQTYNINFSNKGKRGTINHKHFRIYDDKNKIPLAIWKEYANDIIIHNYEELVNEIKKQELKDNVKTETEPTNNIVQELTMDKLYPEKEEIISINNDNDKVNVNEDTKDKEETENKKKTENKEDTEDKEETENKEETEDKDPIKIFVVIKDVFSWLISIKKWSEQCKWKQFKQKQFIEEYALYIKKWIELEKTTENICIIYYEDYINFIKNQTWVRIQSDNFINKLNKFLNQNISLELNTSIKKVKCSNEFNKDALDYYYYKNYMNSYSTDKINNIEQYLQI